MRAGPLLQGLHFLVDATLVGWTGRGRLADLRDSVRNVLLGADIAPEVGSYGSVVLVKAAEPVTIASTLAFVPGVSWVAVGSCSGSAETIFNGLAGLARIYLKKGATFAVRAEALAPTVHRGDLAGRASSVVLDSAKGARINEDAPSVVFRIGFDGRLWTAGVELKKGPGGVPVGDKEVSCLVSGGMHSSVTAWLALLSGFRVELVHAVTSDESLREVARLYGELSHRVDPGSLKLLVLEGAPVDVLIRNWLGSKRSREREVFAGNHVGCSKQAFKDVLTEVRAPLFLLPEEEFGECLASLSLRGLPASDEPAGEKYGHIRQTRFGGKRADMSAVLDGLS
jgi:hypothetical protein